MYWLNGYRIRLTLVGFVVGIMYSGGSANADFTFGTAVPVPNVNTSSYDAQPSLSADGLELYFISNRPYGDERRYDDIWVASRSTTEDDWGEPVKLGAPVNSSATEGDPCISADGLELYFSDWTYDCVGCKLLPGGYGGGDLWVSTRATIDDPWGEPVNLGPTVNSSAFDSDASLSADGLELYFNSNRPGGYGYCDIWVTRRATTSDPWGPPENLGATVNSSYYDGDPEISPNGLLLFFLSVYRPGGYGSCDIWVTRRATTSDPWGPPVNLGPTINSSIEDADPEIPFDGLTFYFNRWNRSSNRAHATVDLWQAPIIPIVDLNGDGIVDALDMCIIVDHWGTDNSLCDIGPTPLGDGVVDVQDLIVLAEHLFEDVKNINSS